MKTWLVIAISVLSTVLIGGVILLVARPPAGTPITLAPTSTNQPITVHVVGAVAQPGVYQLPRGSRAQDAIQAAGGFRADAAQDGLNLASLIEDGERVWAPATSEYAPDPVPNAPVIPAETAFPMPSPDQPVNLNTATQAELESLPEIGPTRAQQIIAYRQEHGAFQATSDLLFVPGIGSALFEKIQNLVTVGAAE